ncbi:MAG TPA: TonB-dependent receptor, partial [Saprospiraceae bacterium]|nr:TonB-dependent receptor [Saprospiraceae bacterium]
KGLSLDQLLQQQSLAFIRSYGAGNLATISLRGATSSQTSLIWNGVPVNNSMLGLADVSNVPVDGFDQLALDFGTEAILYGSSSIGGNIRLESELSFKSGYAYKAQIGLGSFGRRQLHYESSWSNKRFSFNTKMGAINSKNDFEIQQSNHRQSNSAVNRNYLMHTMGWKASENTRIKLDYWKQSANRQVPPTIRQTISNAYQLDGADRIVLGLKTVVGPWLLDGKVSYMNERLDYFDPTILLSSPSSIQTRFTKAEAQRHFGDLKLHFGLEGRNNQAESSGYGNIREEQNYQAIFGKLKYNKTIWSAEFSVRQGRFNNRWIPFIPAADIRYGDPANWMVFAGFSGQYRIPSLNELYWRPGGNQELLPEHGWSSEIGTRRYMKFDDKWQSHIQLNGFYRNVDNWLQWTIPEGGSLFRALNLNEIISYGIESKWQNQYVRHEWSICFDLSYTFVRSYSMKDLRIPKRSSGEQLHYLPRHRTIAQFNMEFHSWNVIYTHQYQSSMDGFNKLVDAYQLGDLSLAYHFKHYRSHQFSLQFELRNIWNREYEIVEFRPMPGRHYQLSIIYSLFKPDE